MTLKQLKYLIDLKPGDQEKWLAQLLVGKIELLKRFYKSKDPEFELIRIKDKLDSLADPRLTPESLKEIRGLDIQRVFIGNISEIVEEEEKLDDLIFSAEQVRGIIRELFSLNVSRLKEIQNAK